MTTWSIDELLPHAGRMILLDRVVAWDAERIVCERVVRAGVRQEFVDRPGRHAPPARITLALLPPNANELLMR